MSPFKSSLVKRNTALVVAAGRGVRAGEGVPKQYRTLQGEPVLTHTLRALLTHPYIDAVLCVIHPDDSLLYQDALSHLDEKLKLKLMEPALGGASRQESVRLGLEALHNSQRPDHVLIHDGARPFASHALISRLLKALDEHKAVIPVLPITDTLKTCDEDGYVVECPSREALFTVQTPQAFYFSSIYQAHQDALTHNHNSMSDDSAAIEAMGGRVHTLLGEKGNIKITTLEDFMSISNTRASPSTITRVGMGYDVHAFGVGDHVMLGGVRIAHTHGIIAHSDGDVILHALTDALLGTIAQGDIGTHFPPSEMRWKGASSDQFLSHACALVREQGGYIVHLDTTLICEKPHIASYRDTIQKRIADIAGITTRDVALKATTSEKMGFTGRAEGLAAHALATVCFES
jgi:2-C-methyl-D-erythritol 4-phosphate cytidylyltransferase / 2-C-methyl-D-erythritol 2,4-cyclodiphosphate synthase